MCLCLWKIRDGLLLHALNADNSEGDKIPITQPYTYLFYELSKNKFLCQMYRVSQKNGNFWKTQQKLKKSKKKNLLTEIEPLKLAF